MHYQDALRIPSGGWAMSASENKVHFDCIYRGITAVSSPESKLLAGNRIIAQPYEFMIGAPPGKEWRHDFVDNPNGLFSAQAAPKPPAAKYTISEGMKRIVIVLPEAGYGQKGMNEIPVKFSSQLQPSLELYILILAHTMGSRPRAMCSKPRIACISTHQYSSDDKKCMSNHPSNHKSKDNIPQDIIE
ncbi:FKBP-type peptidyl-prolyl cis-trans isomerase domain [Dillenia turbinata]|uniref:FKBP-type peptidyl-prolyl cis-trans isomerase domain n=1 Tax=Dillenia turbinata TaxID=194707 RepID=A0AAN8W009_9MAGN